MGVSNNDSTHQERLLLRSAITVLPNVVFGIGLAQTGLIGSWLGWLGWLYNVEVFLSLSVLLVASGEKADNRDECDMSLWEKTKGGMRKFEKSLDVRSLAIGRMMIVVAIIGGFWLLSEAWFVGPLWLGAGCLFLGRGYRGNKIRVSGEPKQSVGSKESRA